MGDILIVDDERDIRELLADIVKDEGHNARLAADSDSAIAEMNSVAPDLVILDIWLKDSKLDGIDILKTIRRDNPDIPVVIISGHGNIEIAVVAVKQGAYDFIEKPFNTDHLMVVVNRALETSRLRSENSALRSKEDRNAVMVGDSVAFKALKAQLDKIANTNSRVMLTGPAGSGKEVAARYIHANSTRAFSPFVSVNSASVEADRMEAVLFGRETEERGIEPGLLERAHNGILFFDEVADMPIGTQSKLLRVLVDQSFSRVGGQDTVRVDVRVISATNKDLQKEIEKGNFREELFHRLNVVPVVIPDLEQRRTDIGPLCEFFVKELNASQGLPIRRFSEDILAQMQVMQWPGNIRQLRNLVERILILGPEDNEVQSSEIAGGADPESSEQLSLGASFATMSLREAREVFEKEYLISQINRFSGNISKTANFVGMERSALHRKLKSLNITTGNKSGAQVSES